MVNAALLCAALLKKSQVLGYPIPIYFHRLNNSHLMRGLTNVCANSSLRDKAGACPLICPYCAELPQFLKHGMWVTDALFLFCLSPQPGIK